MPNNVIDELKSQIETVKKELNDTKSESAKKVEELQKSLEDSKQNKLFAGAQQVVEVDQKGLKREAAAFKIKQILLGLDDINAVPGFKDFSAVVEKTLKPTDLPEWLNEAFSSTVLEDMKPELKVEALFPYLRFPDNTHTFSIPGIVDNTTSYLIQPAADAIESAISSAKVSFQTNRLKTLVGIADQADLETVVNLVSLVQERLVRSLARDTEKAIILGDVDYADANDVRKAFDGLLKIGREAGNVIDGGAAAITAAQVLEARKKLGVYGTNLADLAIIAPVDVAFQMLGLPEVTTFDKYGSGMTICTGEIGRLWGMPIIVSEYLPTDLDADGSDKGAGDTTAVLVVNRTAFTVTDRGAVSLEVERKAVSSTTLFVGYRDVDFKKTTVSATPVAVITNVKP